MKTPQDYEREIAELKRLIERLQDQLTLALDALARTRTIPHYPAKNPSVPILDRLAP